MTLLLIASSVPAQTPAGTPRPGGSAAFTQDTSLLPPLPLSTHDTPGAIELLAPHRPPTMTETEYLAQSRPTLVIPKKRDYRTAGRSVDAERSGVRVRGWLVSPLETSPTAALLWVPGVMGLTDAVRGEADAFARQGVPTLALDLYPNGAPADRRQAFRAFAGLDRKQTVARLGEARAWLADSIATSPTRVGIVGEALAADLALAAAAQSPPMSPPALVALLYGGVTTDETMLKSLPCPLLGFFARRDAYLTGDRVEGFKQALTAAGVRHHVFIYETEPGFQLNVDSQKDGKFAESARERIVESLLERP